MDDKKKKITRLEDLPIEQQIDIVLNSEEFWDYFFENSDEEYSVEAILKRNGVTDEKTIAAIKAEGEMRRKLHPKKYRLVTEEKQS